MTKRKGCALVAGGGGPDIEDLLALHDDDLALSNCGFGGDADDFPYFRFQFFGRHSGVDAEAHTLVFNESSH